MIIGNNFNLKTSRLNKVNNNDFLQKEKDGLQKSINNLDKRYKSGEIDIEKFKKISNNYAKQHEDLNRRIDNNR